MTTANDFFVPLESVKDDGGQQQLSRDLAFFDLDWFDRSEEDVVPCDGSGIGSGHGSGEEIDLINDDDDTVMDAHMMDDDDDDDVPVDIEEAVVDLDVGLAGDVLGNSDSLLESSLTHERMKSHLLASPELLEKSNMNIMMRNTVQMSNLERVVDGFKSTTCTKNQVFSVKEPVTCGMCLAPISANWNENVEIWSMDDLHSSMTCCGKKKEADETIPLTPVLILGCLFHQACARKAYERKLLILGTKKNCKTKKEAFSAEFAKQIFALPVALIQQFTDTLDMKPNFISVYSDVENPAAADISIGLDSALKTPSTSTSTTCPTISPTGSIEHTVQPTESLDSNVFSLMQDASFTSIFSRTMEQENVDQEKEATITWQLDATELDKLPDWIKMNGPNDALCLINHLDAARNQTNILNKPQLVVRSAKSVSKLHTESGFHRHVNISNCPEVTEWGCIPVGDHQQQLKKNVKNILSWQPDLGFCVRNNIPVIIVRQREQDLVTFDHQCIHWSFARGYQPHVSVDWTLARVPKLAQSVVAYDQFLEKKQYFHSQLPSLKVLVELMHDQLTKYKKLQHLKQKNEMSTNGLYSKKTLKYFTERIGKEVRRERRIRECAASFHCKIQPEPPGSNVHRCEMPNCGREFVNHYFFCQACHSGEVNSLCNSIQGTAIGPVAIAPEIVAEQTKKLQQPTIKDTKLPSVRLRRSKSEISRNSRAYKPSISYPSHSNSRKSREPMPEWLCIGKTVVIADTNTQGVVVSSGHGFFSIQPVGSSKTVLKRRKGLLPPPDFVPSISTETEGNDNASTSEQQVVQERSVNQNTKPSSRKSGYKGNNSQRNQRSSHRSKKHVLQKDMELDVIFGEKEVSMSLPRSQVPDDMDFVSYGHVSKPNKGSKLKKSNSEKNEKSFPDRPVPAAFCFECWNMHLSKHADHQPEVICYEQVPFEKFEQLVLSCESLLSSTIDFPTEDDDWMNLKRGSTMFYDNGSNANPNNEQPIESMLFKTTVLDIDSDNLKRKSKTDSTVVQPKRKRGRPPLQKTINAAKGNMLARTPVEVPNLYPNHHPSRKGSAFPATAGGISPFVRLNHKLSGWATNFLDRSGYSNFDVSISLCLGENEHA